MTVTTKSGHSDRQLAALDAMGITLWTRRVALAVPAAPSPSDANPHPKLNPNPVPGLDWEALEREALGC